MASVTHSTDYNFESSNGPTSRTTTRQFTSMNSSDRVKKLMTELSDTVVQLEEKEEEVRRLKEQIESLKEENDRLKQQHFKAPSDQYTSSRNIEVTRKAVELKKVLDDFLSHGQEYPNPNSNRIQRQQYQSVPTLTPINYSEVNKSSTSTSENSKSFRSGLDESATNGTSIGHENGNHTSYNSQDDFSSSRLASDQEIITQATDIRPQMPFYGGHNSNYVPTTVKRFQNGGMNNNNNNNNNNNRNRNNNNNNNNKYTIFIAWTGSVSSVEQLRDLFDPADVADIRYTPPKQFAHVDLRTETAMKKAMSLDQTTKNETQGLLRVETGKPRSSNNNNNNNNNNIAENGQRIQNQNKNNYNRQNNKNPNYNNNLTQKYNNKYNPNYNHNRNNNNHSNQYPNFTAPEEKENTNATNGTNGISSTNAWANFANGSSNPQEPKSTGESH